MARGSCDKCKYFKPLYKHPWNVKPEHKGSLEEIYAHACTMFVDELVILDTASPIGCECYLPKAG